MSTAVSKEQTAEPVGALTHQLAQFVSELQFEALPAAVVEKMKACVLDALGCCLFGVTLPCTRMVSDMALEQGEAPQARILGTHERTSVTQAVLVNSTAAHAFELDDAHTRASMHVGSVNVPVALALGEWLGNVSGRQFITALIAGYEAGLRIGIAADGNIFKRGFHPAAVCGVFASAAAASKVLQLDTERTHHALGIAGSQAAGLMAAQEGAMVKRLHTGRTAQSGVYSALLARRGFTGIVDVLENPFGGFYSAMSERWVPEYLTAGLGHEWETLKVGFKPYATAGAIHSALAALDDIMREGRLSAHEIADIDVRCTTYCVKHVVLPYVPRGVASAQLNMYYALAVMAVDRAALIAQFAEERLADSQLLAFMRKVRVEADPALDALGHPFRYAMRMKVRTADGRQFERESRHRPGSPERALSAQQINDKFKLLAGQVLSAASVDRIIDTVCGLETLDDMRRLSERLVPD